MSADVRTRYVNALCRTGEIARPLSGKMAPSRAANGFFIESNLRANAPLLFNSSFVDIVVVANFSARAHPFT
jgi:hypothetical protein